MNNVTFIFVNAGRTYTDRMVAWLINAFEHGEILQNMWQYNLIILKDMVHVF